jgi:DNA-binding MarR family transcriptional regulator
MAKSVAENSRTQERSQAEEFDLESSIPYLIYRITSRLNQDIHVRLKPDGISLPRWRILASLKSKGRSTVKELATCTVMKHAVVSKVLKEMQDDGLITRAPSDLDQRSVIVDLTSQGEAAFEQARKIANVHRDIALDDLGPDEIQTLLRLLKHIQKNLGISP